MVFQRRHPLWEKVFFTLRLDVWPELMEQGYINIVDIEDNKSLQYNIEEIEDIIRMNKSMDKPSCFGNGNAVEIIIDTVEKALRL